MFFTFVKKYTNGGSMPCVFQYNHLNFRPTKKETRCTLKDSQKQMWEHRHGRCFTELPSAFNCLFQAC